MKSWDDAKTHCETELDEGAGSLVPIHSPEENALVLGKCQSQCWIGLHLPDAADGAAHCRVDVFSQ